MYNNITQFQKALLKTINKIQYKLEKNIQNIDAGAVKENKRKPINTSIWTRKNSQWKYE